MIKAMVFDLDGTLLDQDKKIPDSAKNVLRLCRKKGVRIFLATARPPLLRKMLAFTEEEMGLFDGGIYCNGGCEDIGGNLNYKCLPEAVVEFCTEHVGAYEGLNIALQLKHEVHAFRKPLDGNASKEWGLGGTVPLTLEQADYRNVVKILIFYENLVDSVTAVPLPFVEQVRKYCAEKANIYLTDAGKVMQIVDKKINKYESVENLRKQFGLKQTEIAVFGDDWNDIEMLRNYPYSVAMGNADEEVKTAAGLVTRRNVDGGIAYAVEHLLPI